MDDQQQENHDRNLEIAHNEAKREFLSDVRISTWATIGAIVIALVLLAFYLIHK